MALCSIIQIENGYSLYIFKICFKLFHIALLTVEISCKPLQSLRKTSKFFYKVRYYTISLFKFLFWHFLIYQFNFYPIVEGNYTNLYMVIWWWIQNFRSCCLWYHMKQQPLLYVLVSMVQLMKTAALISRIFSFCYNWVKWRSPFEIGFALIYFFVSFFRASNVLIHLSTHWCCDGLYSYFYL